ncbi:hypothetical protein DENSPDRAFT_618981 [Dentipellis sp. KUC8613]|nr:hypothetical protein DENSPDRAFT_618981 [Dentipellis sp. KUC8613]
MLGCGVIGLGLQGDTVRPWPCERAGESQAHLEFDSPVATIGSRVARVGSVAAMVLSVRGWMSALGLQAHREVCWANREWRLQPRRRSWVHAGLLIQIELPVIKRNAMPVIPQEETRGVGLAARQENTPQQHYTYHVK